MYLPLTQCYKVHVLCNQSHKVHVLCNQSENVDMLYAKKWLSHMPTQSL